jgi:hypothetical protein
VSQVASLALVRADVDVDNVDLDEAVIDTLAQGTRSTHEFLLEQYDD